MIVPEFSLRFSLNAPIEKSLRRQGNLNMKIRIRKQLPAAIFVGLFFLKKFIKNASTINDDKSKLEISILEEYLPKQVHII